MNNYVWFFDLKAEDGFNHRELKLVLYDLTELVYKCLPETSTYV